MCEYKILAAGFADETRIRPVVRDVGSDLTPQTLERCGGSGEVDTRQSGVGKRDLGHQGAVAENKIDHPGREAGSFEQLHCQVRRDGLRG